MNASSESRRQWGAIILAASRGPKTVAEFGTPHKCTLDIAGQPMLMRVLDALEQSSAVAEMVISIDTPDALQAIRGFEAFAKKNRVSIRKSKASAPESAADAVEAIEGSYPILVTTGDNVLLTPQAVDTFCRHAASEEADIAIGLLSEQSVSERFPESIRTFWRFRDGGFKACNLFALLTPRGAKMISLWRHAEKNRKKPWKVAALMGPGLLISFLLRRHSLRALLTKVSSRLDVSATPVILPYPEIAIDVDRQADIVEAEKVLAQRLADSK